MGKSAVLDWNPHIQQQNELFFQVSLLKTNNFYTYTVPAVSNFQDTQYDRYHEIIKWILNILWIINFRRPLVE